MQILTMQINEGEPVIPIIIPVADARDEITRECLKHLKRTLTLPVKIILVESSSSEFAYGKSMNAGIRAASEFDVVFGMDSDAFPEPDSVENLLRHVKSDSRLGYVAAKVLSDKVPPRIGWVHSNLLWFLWNSFSHGWITYATRRLLMGGWWSFGFRPLRDYIPGKMVGAQSTMFALRRQCFEEVGPIDELYRVAFVDGDYCFRILISKNWYLSSCPSATVFHRYHTTQLAYGFESGHEGWRRYLNNWPKCRIKLVLEAAKRGKFLIPANR